MYIQRERSTIIIISNLGSAWVAGAGHGVHDVSPRPGVICLFMCSPADNTEKGARQPGAL